MSIVLKLIIKLLLCLVDIKNQSKVSTNSEENTAKEENGAHRFASGLLNFIAMLIICQNIFCKNQYQHRPSRKMSQWFDINKRLIKQKISNFCSRLCLFLEKTSEAHTYANVVKGKTTEPQRKKTRIGAWL